MLESSTCFSWATNTVGYLWRNKLILFIHKLKQPFYFLNYKFWIKCLVNTQVRIAIVCLSFVLSIFHFMVNEVHKKLWLVPATEPITRCIPWVNNHTSPWAECFMCTVHFITQEIKHMCTQGWDFIKLIICTASTKTS